MKQMKYKLLIVMAIGGLLGCSDFLAESSQSEVRPATVDELYQVMLGEAYWVHKQVGGVCNFLDILTDDIQTNASDGKEVAVSAMEARRPLYAWEREMFEECASIVTNTWDGYYNKIKGCNVILDYMDRVTGSDSKKMDMRGQCLVLRGWYYLQLVNLYGQPYNEGDPTKNPGVPLKLTMDVTDELYPRNSVSEVYEQIVKDLTEGLCLLKQYGTETSVFKVNANVARAILSRVYLYMENWDQAIAYADSVLEIKSSLCRMADFEDIDKVVKADMNSGENGVYNITVSNEVIWTFGTESQEYRLLNVSLVGNPVPYGVSDNLINCFEKGTDNTKVGDLRRYYNFKKYGIFGTRGTFYSYGLKSGANGGSSNYWGVKGIRTAELYLNRAEAYCRKFMETGNAEFRLKALADLNTLREARFDTRNTSYMLVENRSDIKTTTGEDLFTFCQEERRRELAFEDHRWFDLRRWGMPRLEHRYQSVRGGVENVYVLEEKSLHYALPIPESVLDANKALEQNPFND